MLASDIDGALLDYNYTPGAVGVNLALIRQIPDERIALVTNQGGLVFGAQGKMRSDGRPYPTPDDFFTRLQYLNRVLRENGITLAGLRVSLYHPRSGPAGIRRAYDGLRDLFYASTMRDWRIYQTARARKPSPFMLNSVKATAYWGDSDEDEQAALAAGIPFKRVERFIV